MSFGGVIINLSQGNHGSGWKRIASDKIIPSLLITKECSLQIVQHLLFKFAVQMLSSVSGLEMVGAISYSKPWQQ